MAKNPNTSISDTDAEKWLKSPTGDRLQCKKITGFHLIKGKRGGSWRWRYQNAAGKRRVVTVGRYPELKSEVAAQRVITWIAEGTDPMEAKASRREAAISATEAAERRKLGTYLSGRYARHMSKWSARSAKENHQRLELHFGHLFDRDMTTITDGDILEWQGRVEKKGLKYNSIRRTYSSLKTLLRQAVKDKLIDADPLAGFSLDAPSHEEQVDMADDPRKADRRMLTRDEVNRVLIGLEKFADEIREQRKNSRMHGKPYLPDLSEVAYPHWFIPFCLVALHTGLRPGDIYALSWANVNLRFARLTKATEKSKAQIRKGKRPAVVDMRLNDTIKGVLFDWWAQQGRPESGLVFPSPRTNKQLDSHAHRKPWTRVKELGDLPAELNFYCLRHHFISALVAAGVPLLAVAKLAGHKGTAMIEGHYGHLCEELASQAVDIVADSIRGVA